MTTSARPAILEVSGMTCDDCANRVARALKSLGAGEVSVSWRAGDARFTWPESVSEADLRSAVVDAGYRPEQLRLRGGGDVARTDADTGLDLVVLGAGSAAFAAAIRATEAGSRVALVEHGLLGGTCVNIGCVPSKALLRAAELAWAAGHHPYAGLSTSSGPVDLAALVAQKDELVGAMRQMKYADLVTDYGFSVLSGHARFTGPDEIEVDGRRIRARIFLVATGASPAAPPIPGLTEAGYLTSTTALELTEVPKRLVVIGANAIGLELGQFFVHLGARVTFLDVAPRIAPFEEPEVSEALAQVLLAQGATIHTGAQVLAVRRSGGHVDVTVEVAGRRSNTEDFGLEAAGVKLDERGAVLVDDELRTSNPRVFAAGDVTGAPQFVYV